MPIDIDDIQHRVADLHQHLAFCESVIDARPGNASLKLVYEDFYFTSAAQRTEQMSAIWQWLGLAPLDSEHMQYYLDPAAVKINSATTYAWLPNARDIEQRCGNAVTGWLYQ